MVSARPYLKLFFSSASGQERREATPGASGIPVFVAAANVSYSPDPSDYMDFPGWIAIFNPCASLGEGAFP